MGSPFCGRTTTKVGVDGVNEKHANSMSAHQKLENSPPSQEAPPPRRRCGPADGRGEEPAHVQCSMASKSGRAGATTREMAERRALIRAGFGVIAAVVGLIFFTLMPHAQTAGIGAILGLFVTFKVVMNILESKIDTKIVEEKRAIRGAVAEEKID
jgi:hypothetical protein